jgi:hypothetical protein
MSRPGTAWSLSQKRGGSLTRRSKELAARRDEFGTEQATLRERRALAILAKLSCALARARAVPLAA